MSHWDITIERHLVHPDWLWSKTWFKLDLFERKKKKRKEKHMTALSDGKAQGGIDGGWDYLPEITATVMQQWKGRK